MTALDIRLLGALRVERDGQAVSGFRSLKTQALLAYLVASERPLAREHLSGLLWGNSPAAEALGHLRRALHNLSTLLPRCLTADRYTIVFVAGTERQVDLRTFQTLERQGDRTALAHSADLYRGPFLEGLYLDDCPEFETWLLAERERWQQAIARVLGRLVTEHELRGDYEAALDFASRLVELDPWREEAQRHKMLLLARTGQFSAALRQYDACRRVLADELGVAPSPETVALGERLRIAAARQPRRLPAQSTPFVGRTAELAEIRRRLGDPDCRLLTLVGPGGIGKTRIALQAAAQSGGAFLNGVYYCPLAPLDSGESLISALAGALDLQFSGTQDTHRQLIDYLKSKEMLLVLDNFEPLLRAAGDAAGPAAGLVARILSACPDVKLLVTSRERLNLQAEWLLPLAGLPVADDSLALFVESARRVQPDFKPEGQAEPIAAICEAVEGLPLAIELAAGWTPVLSCQQIAGKLRDDLDLLTTRLRDVPERHRSLRALFDQSWRLLLDEERDLLMKLSIFRGGFTADAAAAIGGAGVPVLLALVQKSLVRSDGQGRYDLHELIRRYVSERLAVSGALPRVQAQHFGAYLALAETAEPHFMGPGAIEWFDRLEVEQGNLNAALDWALEHADDQALMRLTLPLAGGYGQGSFWRQRGNWREGAERLRQVLARLSEADSPERVLILLDYSAFLARSGRFRDSLPYSQEAYALAQRIEDPYLLGFASGVMSMAVPAERQRYAQQAIELLRQVGGSPVLAGALWIWGDELRSQGRLEEARSAYEESLQIFREMGNVTLIFYPLGKLGRLDVLDGDLAGARHRFAECVEVCRRTRNRVSLADGLLHLGMVDLYRGEPGSAHAALEESLAVSEAIEHRPLVANILTWLALVAIAEGNLEQAGHYLQQSWNGYTQFYAADGSHLSARDFRYMEKSHLIEALLATAQIQVARRNPDSAATLLGYLEKLLQELHYRLDPPLRAMVGDLHVRLDLPALAPAWAEGRAMKMEDAIREAMNVEQHET
jgi:predicted ATPase/DNA-binding SARP family transcriptional activator